MEHYIGIDLGSEVSAVSIQRKTGKVVLDGALVPTQAKALLSIVKSVARPRAVTFEECTQASWIYSVLEPVVDKIIVCDPTKNKHLSGEKKTDKNDAYNLAERLRAGVLKPVWHGGDEAQGLKELAKCYSALCKDTTRLKLRIAHIFRSRGIKFSKNYSDKKLGLFLPKLPLAEQQARVRLLAETLREVEARKNRAEIAFVKLAKLSPMFKPLTSTPQIGPISAGIFIATVCSPQRFRTKRQFWSYTGLAVTTFESSEYTIAKSGNIARKTRKLKTRGLVRRYNRELKYIIKHAATKLACTEWQDQYLALVKNGMAPENAITTMARKLAAIMLTLAKNGGTYDKKLAFKK